MHGDQGVKVHALRVSSTVSEETNEEQEAEFCQ